MFARQSLRYAANPLAKRNASNLVQKATSTIESATYWSKVVGELSKQVYKKEGLQPPSVAEFQKVYECAVKQSTTFVKDPKAFVDVVAKNAQGTSKDEYLRYLAYAIQVLGFFSLGEIIGRRHVVGYQSH